jgi:hypothetical protein
MAKKRYLAWYILWHIDPLLRGDSVNNDFFWATALLSRSRDIGYARNNGVTVGNGVFLLGPCRDVINKGQSQLLGSSVREALKIEPEGVKLKNLHC